MQNTYNIIQPPIYRALKDLLLVLAVAMTKCVWVKILAMADLFGSIYLDGDGAIISLLRLLYDMTKNDYINMIKPYPYPAHSPSSQNHPHKIHPIIHYITLYSLKLDQFLDSYPTNY